MGALRAVTRPKQALSLDIGHGETIKKRAPRPATVAANETPKSPKSRIDLPKEGRREHWTEPPRRGAEFSLGPPAGYQ